jgi:uncharacterized protein DUF3574
MRWIYISLPILALAGAVALAGCAARPPFECHAGEQRLALDMLYFGTASPSGPVSSAQWQTFVGEVVSAEFPKGYTVLRAEGAWRGEDGTLQREDSYVLQLVHEESTEAEKAIGRISDRYKQKFQQEAVMRTRAATCASF